MVLGLTGGLPVLFMQFLYAEEIIYQLEQLGLFTFILPFLLIFAVVFGVLSQIKIFGDHRGVHVLIALVLGLLAIRFPIYSDFLAIISPKLAVGLVIILAIIVLIGLFTPEDSRAVLGWIMMGVGVVILLVILAQTYSVFQYGYGTDFLTENVIGYVILIALLIGVIVAVSVGGNKRSSSAEKAASKILKPWFGS